MSDECSAYEEVLAGYRERVRLLDVAMNGDGAAKHPAFIDIWDQLLDCIAKSKSPSVAEVEARAFFEAHLDQLDPVVQRHVRALLGEGR